LEDAAWEPRSAAYEIETFANDREDRCTRNEIKLEFQQAR
jgi:hypothetical protein